MSNLPPLRFEPILREYLWGGRRLGSELGKPIGDGDHYAESWEVVDHGTDQSVVADGPLAGATLHELVTQHGTALFGRHHPQSQFPLLFKFLDAQKTLSVQVHPNDAQAAKLIPPDLGKSEAWVVLAAEPGSKIYAGLKPGVDRSRLQRELAAGTCEVCLHEFEPQVGDCILIEAGTVHAIGAGLLIAEIQQASDTTFRLFDWNRIDRDGRPRELHIDEALAVIDFARGPVNPCMPKQSMKLIEQLASCDKFVVDHWQFDRTIHHTENDRFHILAVVDGAVKVTGGGTKQLLYRGDTTLVPACCEEFKIAPQSRVGRQKISPNDSQSSEEVKFIPQGRAVLLDMYLP